MRRKPINVGDTIYFEYIDDGKIGSAIALEVNDATYRDDYGNPVHYKEIVTEYWPGTKDICACIEDYNTLSERNPKVIAYKKANREKEKNFFNSLYEYAGAKTKRDKDLLRKGIEYFRINPYLKDQELQILLVS